MLADRTEALVYLLAHELRHMWQQHGTMNDSSFPVGRVKNAHGVYSEACTESFAIHKLRAWRNLRSDGDSGDGSDLSHCVGLRQS